MVSNHLESNKLMPRTFLSNQDRHPCVFVGASNFIFPQWCYTSGFVPDFNQPCAQACCQPIFLESQPATTASEPQGDGVQKQSLDSSVGMNLPASGVQPQIKVVYCAFNPNSETQRGCDSTPTSESSRANQCRAEETVKGFMISACSDQAQDESELDFLFPL